MTPGCESIIYWHIFYKNLQKKKLNQTKTFDISVVKTNNNNNNNNNIKKEVISMLIM
jgi:hypothetical protein